MTEKGINVPVTVLFGIDGSVQTTNGQIQRSKSFVKLAVMLFLFCNNVETTTRKQQLRSDNWEATTRKRQLESDNSEATTGKRQLGRNK